MAFLHDKWSGEEDCPQHKTNINFIGLAPTHAWKLEHLAECLHLHASKDMTSANWTLVLLKLLLPLLLLPLLP